MKGTFQIEKPDTIAATLTLTLSLGEWQTVQKQLAEKWRWPMSTLSDAITDLVSQATKHFQLEEETP